MSEDTVVAIGFVIVMLMMLFIGGVRWIRDKASHKIIDWLEGPYENSLHAAVSECHKTERWENDCAAWKANFNLIVGLRFYWIPKVRQRLNVIHREKEAKFGGAVQIIARPGDIRLHLRPWTLVRLNDDGKEIGSHSDDTVTRRSTSDVQALRTWLLTWKDAAALMVKDHHDRVVAIVQRDDVFPDEARAVEASSS